MEEESFEHYIPTSIDPGSNLLFVTLAFCVTTILIFPCLSITCRKKRNEELNAEEVLRSDGNYEKDVELAAAVPVEIAQSTISAKSREFVNKIVDKAANKIMDDGSELNGTPSILDGVPKHKTRRHHLKGGIRANQEAIKKRKQLLTESVVFSDPRNNREKWSETKSDIGHTNDYYKSDVHSKKPRSEVVAGAATARRNQKRKKNILDFMEDESVQGTVKTIDISPNDAADASDPGTQPAYIAEEDEEIQLCCGPNALWRTRTITRLYHYLLSVAAPDRETKKILGLALPFTFETALDTIRDAAVLALIGHFIGVDSLAAYVMVEVLLGTTHEFIGGFIDAEYTVCSHALGVGNNFLAGQYIQLGVIIYIVLSIPSMIFWHYFMEQCLLWFEFDMHIAQIGQALTDILIFSYAAEGLSEGFRPILDCTEHQTFVVISSLVLQVLEIGVFCVVLYLNPGTASVNDLAWISLGMDLLYFLTIFLFSLCKGWIKPFLDGMVWSLSLKNWAAVKNLMFTGFPLSVGALLAYGEWEILTFFAAHLGPAEVTAWSILGCIWENFEACTEGIGNAGEIRVARHLGRDNPDMARTSAYKTIFIGNAIATFITGMFLTLGDNLSKFFTNDTTLQGMINDLIPLVGIGNITMTYGMVCWALIGAQGRYRLATSIQLLSSWGFTMPLAAYFTYTLNYNLQGLTASVVMGYTLCGLIMSVVIVRSDWEILSKILQEQNALNDDEESSSSDEDDDSSSSDEDDDSIISSSSSSSSSNSSFTVDSTSETQLSSDGEKV